MLNMDKPHCYSIYSSNNVTLIGHDKYTNSTYRNYKSIQIIRLKIVNNACMCKQIFEECCELFYSVLMYSPLHFVRSQELPLWYLDIFLVFTAQF
jgi:hypothetical protein